MATLIPFPTRLFGEQISKLNAAAEKHGVGAQDLLRLALDRGLLIIEAQLQAEVKVPHIALPPRVLDEARSAKARRRFEKAGK